MQKFSSLSVVLVALLMVAGIGCTTLRDGYGDVYEEERTANAPQRIYVDDPYRGTIVLERDPYSGRYFQVGTYGALRGSIYDPYYRYDNRFYNGYNDRYRSQNYQYNTPQIRQTPTPQQRAQQESNRRDTRERILGEKKN